MSNLVLAGVSKSFWEMIWRMSILLLVYLGVQGQMSQGGAVEGCGKGTWGADSAVDGVDVDGRRTICGFTVTNGG
jgi:hypothetical protein